MMGLPDAAAVTPPFPERINDTRNSRVSRLIGLLVEQVKEIAL